MRIISIKKLLLYLLAIILFISLFIFIYKNKVNENFTNIYINTDNVDSYYNEPFFNKVKIIKMNDVTFNTELFIKKKIDLGFEYNTEYLVGFSGSIVKLPKKYNHYFHITRLVYYENCNNFREKNGLIDITCPILRSFIYAEILDKNFRTINNFRYNNLTYPRIININSPNISYFSGPEDARIFIDPWDNINFIFNMEDENEIRSMYIYNLTTKHSKLLDIHINSKIEKNWIPFFKKNLLYFIPSLENTKNIIDCNNISKKCILNNPRNYSLSLFRGGSPLQNYNNYFVGMARSSSYCKCGKIYRPNLIILSPELDIIYISKPLNYTNSMFIKPFFNYETVYQLPDQCIDQLIITPLTLIPSWNKNIWLNEISLSDQKNIIISLEGLNEFLNKIINEHKISKKIPFDLLNKNKILINNECYFIE